MIDSIEDDMEAGLLASGWADRRKGPLGGMDAEELAMAKKLLERPAPPPPPTVSWFWFANTLGRQWRITRDRQLICRGFTEDSLNAQLRYLKDEGYLIERGADARAVAA